MFVLVLIIIDRDGTSVVIFIIKLEGIRAHRYILTTVIWDNKQKSAKFYSSQPVKGNIHVSDVTAIEINPDKSIYNVSI